MEANFHRDIPYVVVRTVHTELYGIAFADGEKYIVELILTGERYDFAIVDLYRAENVSYL